MKKNMGTADRIIRTAAAVVICVLLLTKAISGTAGIVLGVIVVLFLATSAIGFCPSYWPFGISTRGKEAK